MVQLHQPQDLQALLQLIWNVEFPPSSNTTTISTNYPNTNIKNNYLPDTLSKILFWTRINTVFHGFFITSIILSPIIFIATNLSVLFRVHPCTKLKLSGG